MSTHTATPWGWSEGSAGDSEYPPDPPSIGPEDNDEVICWLNDQDHTKEVWHANAEFIVRAVNCHDELLAVASKWDYYRAALLAREFSQDSPALAELLDATQAAIAKATKGVSP